MAMNTNYFVPPVNLDRVCRVCLLEGTNLSPIFSADQEVDDYSGLPQKIQVCGSIEIHENDGFPSLICNVCVYKASVAHEFRQQCQQSDTRLRLLYDKPARTNIVESFTQTEPQTRIILTRKVPTPPTTTTTYFVKQELQQSAQQDYVSAIEAYAEPVREEHAIDCQDEKLFLCNIGFDSTKEMTDKEASILAHQTHEVECPQDSVEHPGELTTTLITVNADGQLEQRELIVKEDSGKCHEAEMEEEYLNEQLLSESVEESVVQSVVEVDHPQEEHQEHEEPEDETEELQPEDEEQPEAAQPTRTSSRKAKTTSCKSYSEEDEIGDEDYFEGIASDSQDSEEPRFKCNVCSKRYATQKGLKNHAQVHEKTHKCPICLKLFYKLKNMENHRKIHATKPHVCRLCHASFSKTQGLVRHLKFHTDKDNEKPSKPEDPKEDENEKRDPKSDAESDDETGATNEPDEFGDAPGLYKCEVCSQFCSSLKNLKRHTLVHGDKKFSCTVCKKWFFRPDTLKKHAEKHGHGLLDNLVDDNRLFDSDDDSFANSGLATGINNETSGKRDESDEDGVGEYKCQHCDKVMATKKGLRRHVSMHKPKAEPVSCEICKKVCASQARLALHLKTHNKPKEKVQREYLCHICSKVYPSNSSLTYHMRTHTGVKPHVCKICNSGFTTTTSLANHIRIHTGDKPFVCHVCSAAFAVSSAFRRHLTRHTGEANYLCKTCGKAFKRLSTLKEHTYTHSGEKPYVCKTCGAAYSHSGSLFAHQKRCRVQYGEMVEEHAVAHHIHVSNVQTAVRSLAVIGQMY